MTDTSATHSDSFMKSGLAHVFACKNRGLGETKCFHSLDPMMVKSQAVVMLLEHKFWMDNKITLKSFLVFFIAITCGTANAQESSSKVSFTRDVRPILSDKCFLCHGPDEETREADLRFDIKADAFAVIDAGNAHASELFDRITSDDTDVLMPPPEINKPLTESEVAILKQWIEEGADWDEFWAYVPPKKPPIPTKDVAFGNWIDQLVGSRLEQNGLTWAPPADKVTLIRRLYFDLIGLPPTPKQVDAFVADNSEDAIEQVVDRLLASEHFGERLAIYWLDLVRFADTVGYHGDQDHNVSPYRDWVINAFNSNMPLDQFTREQLAGDLLPSPTESQLIASGYNRLLQTTHEGGLQPKEYSAIYSADRVRNVSLVWMGATVGCAQCHDHKYDPYTAKDFYSLAAFFADIDDEKHFKVGTNSLPTKRPPELLIISDSDRAELEAAVITADEKTKEFEAAKKSLAKLQKLTGAKDAKSNTQSSETMKQAKDLAAAKNKVDALKKQLAKLNRIKKAIESRGAWSMITQPLDQPREVRLLPRGNWLDESGPVVPPAVPAFLGQIESEGERATRLDLANWLTDESQVSGQLTARVFANRFWYLFMGVGVSRSLDDFGGQGEAPAFPELLDGLALEFVDSKWDVKSLIKRIVTSRTYQLSSIETKDIADRDPYNQFFSHQSRYRLPAELVRDIILSVSGLLNVDSIGGKSIKPAQPAGYYQHLNFPPRRYKQDNDSRQWRRGVYMHWQRQFLHPSLKAFDAPSREECTAQRPKSNTPSAALALLNDPIFVEAAVRFASRIIRETDSETFDERLNTAFRLAVSRKPDSKEKEILLQLYQASHEEFKTNPKAADELLALGKTDATTKPNADASVLAAWVTVGRAILNMNETITRN